MSDSVGSARDRPDQSHPPERLADRGEFGLIEALRRRLPQGPQVHVGPGDDAAVVAAPDGRVVVTTDVLVSGVHFRTDWGSAEDIGHRAAAASLADIAAMGAVPTALVVALSAPPSLEVAWLLQLADGLRDEAAQVGASVVGGDLARADTLTIAVTALGDLQGRRPVLRAGGCVGDQVAVSGRLGWAEAGLAVLSRGFGSPRALVEAYRRPLPPYADGPAASIAGAHALCDVSDGLVADVGHIATASGLGIDLDAAAFEIPEPIAAVAAAYGADPLSWILTGGHDHALVGLFPPEALLPSGFAVVGRAVAAQGVRVDGVDWSGPAGHEHFQPGQM